MSYASVYRRSLEDPEGFWGEAASALHWYAPWEKVLDDSRPPFYRWFRGGAFNTCYNCLDRHVEAGLGDRAALIYDSPVTDTLRSFTYRELRDEVARFAGALRDQGVAKGDRVVIYMPMVPQAVVAMLAAARIGAIHSVVFGGFAARELAARVDDARPRLIVSASCGIEGRRIVPYKPLLDEAIAMARHQPERTIVLQRPQQPAELIHGRDLDWEQATRDASPADCVPLLPTDPLYVLYTSGTTGQPKGIVRDHGGHAVALKWSMKNIYGVDPGEVYWAASDLGWTVGHSYIVYGPLLHGCTTLLYEGKPVGTPDAGAFWRVIDQHEVGVFFTAPTAFRAIKKEDPKGEHRKRYAMPRFRTLFLAGERCDPDTLLWARETLGIPVIDHYWQTESGWPMVSNCIGLETFPVKPGSPTKAVPGYDLRVLRDDGSEANDGEMGNLVVRLPLPPGCAPTLWGNDEAFQAKYLSRFPGFYQTADAGFRDEDGYLWIMSRTDDVINVAGHRLSTGAIEEVLASHPDVAECAVIGVADSLKGQLPLGLVVLKSGAERAESDVVPELVSLVRDRIGPVAVFKQAALVRRLPKTRSGKVLRGTMRQMADGEAHRVPPTIDDPVILDEIAGDLKRLGYPKP
jgi:propionyl-CoA synthetase